MLSENIIFQSAGSLSVAVMALLMLILQTLFFFRKPQCTWYAWSAAISFSALLYSVGIFLEYNTPEGPLNRFSGLLEYTAIICLIQCLYGFTFSYLGIESKRYHPVAGVCHGLILILLWSTNYVVAEIFTTRDFIGLESPYIEPALGPLGPLFVLYAAIAGVNALIVWIKFKRTDSKHRIAFLAGMGFWLLLGIHDGLASLGLPTLQYFMEYGFLGFAMVVLWVVFSNYLEIEAEEKYRVITEFANDCILVIQDGKMVFRNPACCDLIGGPLTASATRDFLDIIASEDRKTVLKDYNTLLERGHAPNPYTVRIRGADGEQRFVEIASSLIQYRNRPAVLAIMRDMTERKRAEEAIRESEERFRLLSEASFEGILIHDKGEILDANQTFAKIFGYELDEIIGMNVLELAAPEWRDVVKSNILSGFEEAYEAIGVRKDGSTFPGELRGRRIEYKGNTVRITAVKDLSEQKKAEEALQESEEKYRDLVELLPQTVFELDERGFFTFANRFGLESMGYTQADLDKGLNAVETVIPEDRARVKENMERRLRGEGLGPHEYTALRKDGSTFPFIIYSTPLIRDNKPVGLRGISVDITERKRLEAHLFQARKMEAITTLAGGVAHEFNNAMMVIVGNIELLKMDLPEDERRDKYFNAMKSSGHRMSRLIDQLLAYAQGGKYQPKDLKLDDFVIETLPILQHDLSPTVRVETHFQKDISYIRADHTQMQIVLSAILANSNEAIEDVGLIKISVGNEDLDEDFTKQHPGLKPGPYVCLTIEDEGKGMDEETRSGIFEPFFTTKFQGRGMGMAAVHGIVKNHDGWISVDSELDKGTVVRIYLPPVEVEVRKEEMAKIEPVKGTGTILVIEDEDMVIEVTQAMLERLGYRVMVAKTGKEAIHITETFNGDIDLALLDIKLPYMEGGKVYPLIMEARPNLKVIVFSGYAIDGPARKILDAGAQDFIQKPFSLATLSEKVKEVLEGK